MSYPTSMGYDDLGVNFMDDPTQPSGPADEQSNPTGGGITQGGLALPGNLQVTHGIALLFFLSLFIYTGAAYWFFRRINQAV